jgi:hypothetical protein
MDPNHDSYTHRQRGSEAAVPILVAGMKAKRCLRAPSPRIVLGELTPESVDAPKLVVWVSPVACLDCVAGHTAGLKLKPSGTTPVLT